MKNPVIEVRRKSQGTCYIVDHTGGENIHEM
jgi:hypothetical protein